MYSILTLETWFFGPYERTWFLPRGRFEAGTLDIVALAIHSLPCRIRHLCDARTYCEIRISSMMSNPAKKNFLVVDDDPRILSLFSQLLTNEGHHVVTADDSLAALHILKDYIPDIMIVDVVMPYIGGDKLCRIVREIPELEDLFIVVISAVAS